MFEITKNIENQKATLALKGKLDTTTAPELDKTINEIISDIKELVFDFADLKYISSAGLRVLLSAQKLMNSKGEMKVCNVCEGVMEIFEVTGFSDILTIV
ncbi:MAG: STAS domain-containing protein [Clostridia bacterium]|nr:STAS domain-containing protein [Clostridia bacterium]